MFIHCAHADPMPFNQSFVAVAASGCQLSFRLDIKVTLSGSNPTLKGSEGLVAVDEDVEAVRRLICTPLSIFGFAILNVALPRCTAACD